MAEELYDRITEKEKDFADLWNRMDNDKKLLTQEKFVWYDEDDREQPDVDNITLNDAAVFANKVHNTLIRAEIIPEIEGEKLKDEEAEVIESFISAIELEADLNVARQDIPSYKNFEMLQNCDRGRIARRVTLREENGKLAPDSFTAVDSRYLVYEYGIDGLLFAGTKMPRNSSDVKDEYGYEPSSKNVIITDAWDDNVEEVYCGKEKIWEQENFWKEPPFVIQVVPTGLYTFDADRFLYSGESIFGLNRELFKEKNTFASILKSLTIRSFFGGLQLEVEDVALAKKPQDSPYSKRTVIPVQKGTKGYFKMPIEDLQSSARLLYQILDEALQNGALPKVSYGVYPAPASGVGIAELKEAEDPVYFPRIQGYTLFLQRLYRMVINQYTMFKFNLKLGEPGFERQFNWKDLDKDVTMKFQITLTSPKMDMVNISTAAAVGNLVSDDTKRRDYLHLKNPDEENNKMLAEKAARMSPAVAKYDVIKALYERGEKVKAKLMALEMDLTLEEVLSGKITEPEEMVEEQEPKQIVPMYGAGGAGGANSTPLASEAEV